MSKYQDFRYDSTSLRSLVKCSVQSEVFGLSFSVSACRIDFGFLL